ncbi:hypothetical protein GIB67_036248 [Kingdonia uniflora]|uniref:Protein decapping 5 n=1 Tax=Kingdonia uniflora TaxID=39325 RepID=A0A7J7NU22_9MAGN|nr:hypothetical protein GIB67_036248 [Kingdonia uniflora]
MAADATRSGGAADSYIGSLISLTSKSEIRYEGVLYNINTEESSIGLRNVKSFGTEGRKKDGPQVPPNDKVYDYILFRGSDIKDLQVKSSPPVPIPQPIHNDPAIIQSHYARPASSVSTSLPPAGGSGGPAADLSSQTAQMGLPRSTFQGALPLYQPPGGSLGSWGSSPPPPSANVPMYWQGYYGPPTGLPPHLQQQQQQQPLLRPPAGLSMPHLQQQMQYPNMHASLPTGPSNLSISGTNPSLPIGSNLPFGMNPFIPTGSNLPLSNLPASSSASSLPEFNPPLMQPVGSSAQNLTSTTSISNMPSTLGPAQPTLVVSETTQSLMLNKAPTFSVPTVSTSLPFMSTVSTSGLDINAMVPPVSNNPKAVSSPSLPYQTTVQSVSSTSETINSSQTEASTTPLLVTPGQLLPGSSTIKSSQTLQPTHKDVEVVQTSSSEPPPSSQPREVQAPILPLPSPPVRKMNGPPSHVRHNYNNNYNNNYSYRGRERGRGNGFSRPVAKFTEDFDFTAMNEKFKKDEVWGHLGKSKQVDGDDDYDGDLPDEDYAGSAEVDKPVYVKDDFFDSISCNADSQSGNGRTKFSEQMKLDTETFGDSARHRGGRGGRGPGRGGRSRGSYYGRGYGYVGRGRGQNMSSRGY